MDSAELTGIVSIKIPVTDLKRSLAWYRQLFGLEVVLEFEDSDGVVRGVGCEAPGLGPTMFALREDPDHARGFAGFAPINFGIADKAAAEAWIERLDEIGIEHSPIIDATRGWIVVFHDPDGLELHLYTEEMHHIDQSSRPGYGRPVRIKS